jgi:cytochrome c553
MRIAKKESTALLLFYEFREIRSMFRYAVFCLVFLMSASQVCAQNAAAIAAGKAKAIAACNMCHGEIGISNLPNAPHLAGQPEMYMVEQLKAMRSGKRPSETMVFIAKPLTDDEINNLAAWYASIEIKATLKTP